VAVGCGDSGVVYEEGGEGDLMLNGAGAPQPAWA
jgi:hypothetical protein